MLWVIFQHLDFCIPHVCNIPTGLHVNTDIWSSPTQASGQNKTGFTQDVKHVVKTSMEWPERTRCPALLCPSYLNNKVCSVSFCVRPRRLCNSVVVPLVILRPLSFIQIETAQQDCGEAGPGERMYMWSEWVHLSHFPTLLSFVGF